MCVCVCVCVCIPFYWINIITIFEFIYQQLFMFLPKKKPLIPLLFYYIITLTVK